MSLNQQKWKVFADGQPLYADAGVGQNLGTDLEKAIADELDDILAELLGSGAVVTGWGVTPGTGLEVLIAAGTGYVLGQRGKSTAQANLSALPPSSSGIKVYVQLGSPFSISLRAWPASFGYTMGALSAGQYQLASVDTSGSGVASITDLRTLVPTLPSIPVSRIPSTDEKAALGGTVGTPGASNKYVTNSDPRLQSGAVTMAMAAALGVL